MLYLGCRDFGFPKQEETACDGGLPRSDGSVETERVVRAKVGNGVCIERASYCETPAPRSRDRIASIVAVNKSIVQTPEALTLPAQLAGGSSKCGNK